MRYDFEDVYIAVCCCNNLCCLCVGLSTAHSFTYLCTLVLFPGKKCPSPDAAAETCDAGTYSAEGWSYCVECPTGFYSSSEATSCLECTAGYQCANATVRVLCEEGTYSSSGKTACDICPGGSILCKYVRMAKQNRFPQVARLMATGEAITKIKLTKLI